MEHSTSGIGDSSSATAASHLKVKTKASLNRAVSACALTLEPLEQRVLMSAAPPVVQIKWAGHSSLVFEDQYVAQTKPGVDFNAVAARQGFTDLRNLGAPDLWQFNSTRPVAWVSRWSHLSPNVVSVSPNYRGTIDATIPNDPFFPRDIADPNALQWHLNNLGQRITNITGPFDTGTPTPGVPGADIHATQAWDITTGSNQAKQLVIVSATSGTFTLSYAGTPTAAIAFNASALAVQTALDAILPAGITSTVTLTNNTYSIQFTGPASTRFQQLIADGTGLIPGTITVTENDLVVGIMDTGIDLNHPDLVPNLFTNPGEAAGVAADGIDNDGNGYADDVHGWDFFDNKADVTDLNGHGTHVSGIVGAVGNNGIGTVGVNWNIKLLPLDVSAGGDAVSFAAALAGLSYATQMKHMYDTSGGVLGANLVAINASFGGGQFPFDHVFSEAIERLNAAGILFVAAAGNDAINVDNSFDFPAKFSLTHPGVVTVAATDNQDNLAFFSNTGAQTALLGAPGVSIYSTTPTYPVTLTTEAGLSSSFGVLSGTSQATPTVTGILALEKAANPNATLVQLRQALLNGVDQVPSLMGNPSGGARQVFTGGRANAYKALLNILNPFLQTDTDTQGNWNSPGGSAPQLYGAQGVFIAGESTTFPAIANGSITGATSVLIKDSTRDPRALQTIDGSTHIAGALVSSTSMTFDFNFTDGKAHQVALYMVDYDLKRRSEKIDVVDPITGQLISGEQGQQNVTNFARGKYFIYELRGHVQLRVTRLSGPNAVVNGIFIDPAQTNPLQFISTDSTTAGSWRNRYGSQGAYVVGASPAFPDFVINTTSGAGTVVRQKSTKNPTALENPNDVNHSIMAYLVTPTSMTLDMTLTDSKPHRVTLYVADYENLRREERIEILDPNTLAVESETTVSDFARGKYVTFELSGHHLIRITKMSGLGGAVLSGVFFDAPPSTQASYAGIDTVTRGNWKTNYGADGSYVVGDTLTNGVTSFNLPLTADQDTANVIDSVDVNLIGTVPLVLHSNSRDRNALLKTNALFSADRIIAGLYTHTTETIDLKFNDAKIHRLSLYAWDSDKEHRDELITVTDANGNPLATQKLANFQNGKYITFDVTGHVQVQVARTAGDTAVINGIFFD